jgi:nitroreductase
MDAIEMLKSRRSVRAYENKTIAREILGDIVDCARLAPTAMNQQAWEFIVVTEKAGITKLAELVGHAKFLPGAAACIVVLCKDNQYYVEDGSAATQNILLAARAHGLGSCWIAGDKQAYADPIRQYLGAPTEYKTFSLISLGYPAENPTVEKRPLESVLRWEKF